MAWIELHNSIWTHPKIKPLAEALNIDRMLAAAYLIRFWTWAIEHIECVDGEITHLSYEDVSAAAGWRKSSVKFVDALISSHWFDRKDEQLYIHDWNDYASRLIRKRISDRERKRNNNSDGIPTEFAAHTVPNRTIDTNVSLCPNTNSDENTKKRKTPIFDHESDPYRLAAELYRMIHENNPSAKQQTEANLQHWAKAIELMLRRDKRTAEQAWSVMKFSQQDVLLKAFCLQYPEKKRKIYDLHNPLKCQQYSDMPHGSGVGEPTANAAEQAAQLSKDCELIERTAKEINTEIAEHLLLAVTQDFTWRYLHMLRGLKTGEKKFCYLRRKFFNLLAKKKGMV